MPEKHISFPLSYVAAAVVGGAIISAGFGFVGGLLATNSSIANSVASALPLRMMHVAPSAPIAPSAPTYVSDESATIATVKNASPAVVSIVISRDVPVYEQTGTYDPFGGNDPFSGMMPDMQVPQYQQKGTQKQEVGAGSGFIVSSDGYIVTNKHVVEDDKADYTVITTDGKKYNAKVLARDPSNDIAVIKIDVTKSPFLTLGDSSALQVGQRVIAIGNALGQFGGTVSTGVVSGLKRSISAGDGSGTTEDLFQVIQTDAAINPGNSGGPLLNIQGKVIGVNVAVVQGSQNIGFALPINEVRQVVDGVRKTGKISRPFLGVRYVLITPDIKAQNSLSVDYGALVLRGTQQTELAVSPGSPADKAGIQENDIILEVNGEKINQDLPLSAAIEKYSAGQTISVKLLRKGAEKTVSVTLQERTQ